MAVNHKVISWIVALAFGLSLSWCSYERITDPEPAAQRALEESVVNSARAVLQDYLGPDSAPEFVDPLSPDRKVGKVFIFPEADAWQVSGYYRRRGEVRWNPFLMVLDADRNLVSLSVRDTDIALTQKAANDPLLTVTPRRP